MSENNFSSYGLSEEIIESLTMIGYKKPTPIQQMVLSPALAGKDIVGKAQTGSGKTAAFAIPLCENVEWDENLPQALVLEPTRELAVQVGDELFYIGRKKRIKVPVIFGGMPIDKQTLSLKQKAHIVVGTPGRVQDHMRRGNLNLSQVKYLVIDEADLMLDMGFLDDVKAILKAFETKPQMMLFSATMDARLDDLIADYMPEAVVVKTAEEAETPKDLTQLLYEVDLDDKFDVLLKLLVSENPENAMIFGDTREIVNTIFQKMRRKGIRCGMLHGGMEQRERLYAIGDFRKEKFHYLVTTDVACRGIDFDNITHVINYDFPTNRENYVHRIGRTARNGRSGKAISLVAPEEMYYLRAVEAYLQTTIARENPEEIGVSEMAKQTFRKKQKERVVIKEGKEAAFKKDIMKLTIGGGKKSKMRAGDVVGTICSLPGLTQEDIGVIDVRDSLTYVEIMNGKGQAVYEALQKKPIKGKLRKVKMSHN